MQKTKKTLQECASVIKQLAQQALIGLPPQFIYKEAAHTFVDGLRDSDIKRYLLPGTARIINNALLGFMP